MSASPPIATAKADAPKPSCLLWANSGHCHLANRKTALRRSLQNSISGLISLRPLQPCASRANSRNKSDLEISFAALLARFFVFLRSAAWVINWLNRLRNRASRISSMLSARCRTSASNCSLTRVHSFTGGPLDIRLSALSAFRLIGAGCQSVSDAVLQVTRPRTQAPRWSRL